MTLLRAMCALLVVASGLGPAAPARAEPTEGAFTAQAYPFPGNCLAGTEGVHRVTMPFTAPADGFLSAEVRFEGDWNLFVVDARGVVLASGTTMQTLFGGPFERVRAKLTSQRPVSIVVCNRLSPQTTVEVTYRFATGDGYRGLQAPAPGYEHLSRGGPAGLDETLPVTFVFVGYDGVDRDAFVQALPARSRPIERYPDFYGLRKYLGIDYVLDHRIVEADADYEDRLFSYLAGAGRDVAPTIAQTQYNQQASNVMDVGTNFEIPVQSVERWLGENPPAGVDTTSNTVFFINWYGREDFRFHVYSKLGETDPDAGVDRGAPDSARLIAWGGTPPDDPEDGTGVLRRVWFHDLSAGPDITSGGWAVDTPATSSYIMPPIWEYADGGYRAPGELTADLARIARYVAIDLLLTPAPLYSPALTPPALPDRIDIDLNTYEGQPGTDASEVLFEPDVIQAKVAELAHLEQITVDEQDLDFLEPRFTACYQSATRGVAGLPGCYPDRPYDISGNLLVHAAETLGVTRDDPGSYEIGVYTYADSDTIGPALGFAFAEDNHRDGTQSFVHIFVEPQFTTVAGRTDTAIHEVGHHLGLSHTHDGYDSADDLDFFAGPGRFAFVWVGDEVNSRMSYYRANNEFSQFDRDNRNRWMTAAYISSLNAIVDDVLESEPDGDAALELADADADVGAARAAFAAHGYLDAVTMAHAAYGHVLESARLAGVTVEGDLSGTTLDPRRAAGIPVPAYPYSDERP